MTLLELRGQWRAISFLPNMADKLTSSPKKRKDYREEKILGYHIKDRDTLNMRHFDISPINIALYNYALSCRTLLFFKCRF